MATTRILVVVGTPIPDSLTHALAHSYAAAARRAGAEVRLTDLATQEAPAFPHTLGEVRMPRDERDAPLDPVARTSIQDVTWAQHLVFFFPQWWGGTPAVLKAWIDRVFLSGFAYRYHRSGSGWDRLLTGRSARIVMTMDSPRWWNALAYRDSAVRTLRTATLRYSGIAVRGVTRLAEVRHSSPSRRARWLETMARLGTSDAGGRARRIADGTDAEAAADVTTSATLR